MVFSDRYSGFPPLSQRTALSSLISCTPHSQKPTYRSSAEEGALHHCAVTMWKCKCLPMQDIVYKATGASTALPDPDASKENRNDRRPAQRPGGMSLLSPHALQGAVTTATLPRSTCWLIHTRGIDFFERKWLSFSP